MHTTTPSNRRIRRSTKLYEALTYQIEAVCDDFGLSHLAFGSDEGFVIAFSGAEKAGEWLAAVAPGVHEGWFTSEERATSYVLDPPTPVSFDTSLTVENINVNGSSFFLAGLADKGSRSKAGIAHATRGIQRIFDELRPS